MVSPNRRVGREVACEALFGHLSPAAAANALSRALSLARSALMPLGVEASACLRADRSHIWSPDDAGFEVDYVAHEAALRSALALPAGLRDADLASALADERVLLEDEPYADWAIRPREVVESLRQRGRLELARDRSRGLGRSQPDAVIEAWERCLAHDPSCEEAAAALMRIYAAHGRHPLVTSTYARCQRALQDLGLRTSPALEEACRASTVGVPREASPGAPTTSGPARLRKEERRLVSVLFAELSAPATRGQRLDPEDMRALVGGSLAGVIAEVEGLGGMVTSVSGAGLVGLFGAPDAHEDDPERAVRAGFRALTAVGGPGPEGGQGQVSLRVGIETGRAVVGPLTSGVLANYGAMGEVVAVAAALQSAARPGSVLVGPVTRGATEGIFDWGPTEDVMASPSAKPVPSTYLAKPKARSSGRRGPPGPASGGPLFGRQAELATLEEALRGATSGQGSVVLVVGEPGLGKTRLVYECRKRFMAWVGAGTGRLPLWLEGRGASYASSTPFGLYQQLLSAWIGVAPEEGEEAMRPALDRAVKVLLGQGSEHGAFLAHLMGLGREGHAAPIARLSPEGLQRATFAAIKTALSKLAHQGPTVLVLEDLHWADPTSLRLTEELAEVTRETPLLLLGTRRPEPDPGTSALERSLTEADVCRLRKLELAPLAPEAERQLARALVNNRGGEDVIDALCAHSEGNPLFLEEQLSSLLEAGALGDDATEDGGSNDGRPYPGRARGSRADYPRPGRPFGAAAA